MVERNEAGQEEPALCLFTGWSEQGPKGGLGSSCGWAGTLQVPGRRLPGRGVREAEVLQGKRTAGLEVGLPAGVGEAEAEGPGLCPEGVEWNPMRAPPSTTIGSACDSLFSQLYT